MAQQRGAVQGRSAGLGRGTAWDRAGVQHGAAYWRGMGPCRSAARGREERSSVGQRRGVAAWGCAGARHGAVQGRRSAGLRRGAAWGCVGAQRFGAAQGRSSVGLRRGAARGCAGAQRGTVQGRAKGLRRGAARGCAGAQ